MHRPEDLNQNSGGGEGKKKLEGACLKVLARESEVTSKIFHTDRYMYIFHTEAKKNESFSNFEDEINLQEMNEFDMGRILHSTKACINIVNHIGTEMKKALVNKTIESRCKVALMCCRYEKQSTQQGRRK